MDEFEEVQARIDAMFEDRNSTASPIHERICALAKRGIDTPGALSPPEIRQICYALVVHYAQMGIGG